MAKIIIALYSLQFSISFFCS